MALEVDIRKTLRSARQTFHLHARFSVHSPRIVVHGPSGAGKSLLLKAIAGLITPDEGSIVLCGATLFDSAAGTNVSPQARRVAYLFQDYALFPHLTVRQNVGFGLRRGWLNLHGDRPDPAIDSWLEAFELCRVAHQYPSQISGGQRQRTALARALVARPPRAAPRRALRGPGPGPALAHARGVARAARATRGTDGPHHPRPRGRAGLRR